MIVEFACFDCFPDGFDPDDFYDFLKDKSNFPEAKNYEGEFQGLKYYIYCDGYISNTITCEYSGADIEVYLPDNYFENDY